MSLVLGNMSLVLGNMSLVLGNMSLFPFPLYESTKKQILILFHSYNKGQMTKDK